MSNMKWTEGDYNNYVMWLQSLQPDHLANIWQDAKSTTHPNPPSIGNVPGSTAPKSPNDFIENYEKLFG